MTCNISIASTSSKNSHVEVDLQRLGLTEKECWMLINLFNGLVPLEYMKNELMVEMIMQSASEQTGLVSDLNGQYRNLLASPLNNDEKVYMCKTAMSSTELAIKVSTLTDDQTMAIACWVSGYYSGWSHGREA